MLDLYCFISYIKVWDWEIYTMAKDKRYFVTCTMEVYVPDQGCGDKALKNEDLDANWFASTIGYMIPNLVNKEFKYSERPYSVNHVYINKIEK